MRGVKKENVALRVEMNIIREISWVPVIEWRLNEVYRGWETKFQNIVYLNPSLSSFFASLGQNTNHRYFSGWIH